MPVGLVVVRDDDGGFAFFRLEVQQYFLPEDQVAAAVVALAFFALVLEARRHFAGCAQAQDWAADRLLRSLDRLKSDLEEAREHAHEILIPEGGDIPMLS
jgi:hypothetical protein